MSDESTKGGWGPAIAATLAMVLVSMDLFMMPIATSALVGSFQTDAGMVQAAIALFSLVFAGLCIIGGKLGDLHGKKRIFVIGILVYGAAALITAIAPSMLVVILGFSVVRAVAVALAIPNSLSLIVANYDTEARRGQAFAIYGVGAMVAGLIAPLLMGFMADKVSWRVPFFMELGIVAFAVLMARKMKETPTVKASVDWLGTAFAFIAIGAIILAGMLGGRFGWWDARRPFEIAGNTFNPLDLSPAALLIGLGLLAGALLVNHVGRTAARGGAPLFRLALFEYRTYAVVFVMGVIFFLLNGAIPFVVPVFLQQGVSFDGAQTGTVMTTFMIGSLISSLGSGALVARLAPRTLLQLALLVIAAGLVWLLAITSPSLGVVTVATPMFVVGLGFGVIVAQMPNIQLSALPADLQGEGSGLGETSKEIGVGLGTAVVGSIMFSLAIGAMVDGVARQADVELTAAERTELILMVEDEALPEDVDSLIAERVPDLQPIVADAYVDGFKGTVGVLIGIVLVVLFITSFIPRARAADGEAPPGDGT